MNEHTTFKANETIINLDEVSSFQDSPQAVGMPANEPSLIVELTDGAETVVQGNDESEAFLQAMDDHLGI